MGHKVGSLLAPVIVGFALGAVVLLTTTLPSQWAGLSILAISVLVIAVLINDVGKLVLIAMAANIPLGLDISVGGQPGHVGGPSGFVFSLLSVSLCTGFAFWLTNAGIDKTFGGRVRHRWHGDITIPATAFLFALLLSAFQARNVQLSMAQLFLEVQFFLMYWYLINHARSWANFRLLLTAVLVCLLLESVLMLLQAVSGFELESLGIRTRADQSTISSATTRVAGTLGSPNSAATYLAASLAIALAVGLAGNRIASRILAVVALALGTVALVGTQSRSGWIAFAVAMLILIFVALRKRIGAKSLLLLCIVALMLAGGLAKPIIERVTTDDLGAAESRIWYVKLALNVLEDHAFTGVGLNNLWLVQNDYVPIEMGTAARAVVHNKYLVIWTETGLLGFLAFLWLLTAASRRAIQSLRRIHGAAPSMAIAGSLAALVVFMVHMLSDPFGTRRMEYFWFLLALLVVSTELAKRAEERKQDAPFQEFRQGRTGNGELFSSWRKLDASGKS